MKVVQYAASLVFARFGQLIALIMLSFIATPDMFGVIALAAANTILLGQVCGAWITGAALRGLSRRDDDVVLSTIACATCIACATAVVAAGVWGVVADQPWSLIAAVAVFAMSLIAHDVVLAQLNAREFSGRYLLATMVRGGLLLIVPVAAFWHFRTPAAALLGFACGAAASAVVGAVMGRLFRNSLRHISAVVLWDMFRFGVAATFASAFLVLVAGVLRNAVFMEFGAALAGRMSLTLDSLIGLFSVANSAISLKFLPSMYKAGADRRLVMDDALPYLVIIGCVCLGTAMMAWMLPMQTIGVWVPAVADRWTENLARPLILFVASAVMFSAGLAVIMASGLKKAVVLAVTLTVLSLSATTASVVIFGGDPEVMMWAAAALLFAAATVVLWGTTRTWSWKKVGRPKIASATLAVALLLFVVLFQFVALHPVAEFVLFSVILCLAGWILFLRRRSLLAR